MRRRARVEHPQMTHEQRDDLTAIVKSGDRAAIAKYAWALHGERLPWASLFYYATVLAAGDHAEHFLRKLLDDATPPPWWSPR